MLARLLSPGREGAHVAISKERREIVAKLIRGFGLKITVDDLLTSPPGLGPGINRILLQGRHDFAKAFVAAAAEAKKSQREMEAVAVFARAIAPPRGRQPSQSQRVKRSRGRPPTVPSRPVLSQSVIDYQNSEVAAGKRKPTVTEALIAGLKKENPSMNRIDLQAIATNLRKRLYDKPR